jgi:hypothetical protein
MKIFQSGNGPTISNAPWAMQRVSGERQQLSLWVYPSGVPTAGISIGLIPADGTAAAPVYAATPTVPTLVVLQVDGPFTIFCSSSTTNAGAFAVYAQ